MARQEHLYHDRVFVNPKGNGYLASINITVEAGYLSDADKKAGKKEKPWSYSIEIMDCNRKVSIHGDINKKWKLKVAIKKVERMIRILERFLKYLNKLKDDM